MELTVASLALAAVGVVALWLAGFVVWIRTRHLRRGAVRVPAARFPARTSATTLIPGLTGILVMLAGAGLLRAGRTGAAPWIVVAAGGLVGGSGFRARVTRVEVQDRGLLVRYTGRRSFVASWERCRALLPPRWPPGAWTIVTDRNRCRLMPTDVLGQERLLDLLVARSGLRFDRRTWRLPLR